MHADAVTASEAAVHKGAAEPSLHTESIGEKGVVDKGSYGPNPTIGEALFSCCGCCHTTMHPSKI